MSGTDDGPQGARETRDGRATPDLSGIAFVHRITIGSGDPERRMSERACAEALAELNRCLSDRPRGRLIATEKSFAVATVAEQQVVTESISYHIGFPRRPAWLLC